MAKKSRPRRRADKKAKKTKKTKKIKKTASSHPSAKEVSFDMPRTKIRVIGVGGGAGNIVAEIAMRVPRVDFIAANTDVQDLKKVPSRVRAFPFGQKLTRGLGCGMDADLGEQAARAEKDRIKKLLEGQDIVIIIAALGGGTGSGAIPVFVEAAREAKSLVLGIFALPFEFEGKKRKEIAASALEKVKPLVNAYVTIPNERIFQTIEKSVPFPQALSAINRNLADSLGGLIEALYNPGLINIDFADVKSILEGRGRLAYASAVAASGIDRTKIILNTLFASSLYEYGAMGADRILFHISGDKHLKMHEVAEVSKGIFSMNPKARIILGITLRPELRDKLKVTLFAVGCVEGLPAGKAGKQPMQSSQDPEKKVVEPRKKQRVVQKKTRLRKATARQAVKPAHNASEAGGEPEKKEEEAIERTRKNALDLKHDLEGELREIQEKEKKWDVPAFLRVKVKR